MCTLSLSKTPALKGLVPFALGIYLSSYNTLHRLALLGLVCGVFLFALALILRPRAEQVALQLHKGLIYLALMLTLTSLGYCYSHLRGSSTGLNLEAPAGLRLRCLDALKTSSISPSTQGLMAAMTLGTLPHDKPSSTLRHDFALSGAAHLLAVSGFHLGVVMLIFSFLLRPLALSRRWYYLCLILASWLFTALTSFNVPTIRASIMLSVYLGGKLLGRERNTLNILAASCLIQLFISPQDLYRWGLWLSYSAVLSLVLYYEAISSCLGEIRQPLLRYVWSSLALCLSANILVLPLSLYLFGFVSWTFLFTSVPLTLLSIPFIWLSLMAYLLALIGYLPSLLAFLLETLGQTMLWITHTASLVQDLTLHYSPPLWLLILYWAGAILWGLHLRHRREQKQRSSAT